jgi:hypothetical protein
LWSPLGCSTWILTDPYCIRILISVWNAPSRFGSGLRWCNAFFIDFLGCLRVSGAVSAWLGCKLSWGSSCLYLGKSTVVHLLAFFD